MGQDERRKYRRLDVDIGVKLSVYDPTRGATVARDSRSRNVSAGGLLITTESPLEISSFVLADFTLPGKERKRRAIARVVRVDEVAPLKSYDIGLEFLENLPEADTP